MIPLRVLFYCLCVFLSLLVAGSLQAQPLVEGAVELEATSVSDTATEALLHILKDPSARDALIEQLEQSTVTKKPGTVLEEESKALAHRVADFTKVVVESGYVKFTGFFSEDGGFKALLDVPFELNLNRIHANGAFLVGTIITTIAIILLMNNLTTGAVQKFFPTSEKGSGVQSLLHLASFLIAEIVALALAYTAGQILAVSIFGKGYLLLEQSLYLNAFLIVGVFGIILRIFVAPTRANVALAPFDKHVQASIQKWLMGVFGFIVYGFFAVAPIIAIWTSYLAGDALRLCIIVFGFVLMLACIRAIYLAIKNSPMEKEKETSSLWVSFWPIPAIIYTLICFGVALAQPEHMADLIGVASLKTIVAVACFLLVRKILQHFFHDGFPMPVILTSFLPAFKGRLDGYLRLFLKLFYGAIVLFLLGYVLDAWQVFDVFSWLSADDNSDLIWRIVTATLIFWIVVVVWAAVSSWIDHKLSFGLIGQNVNSRKRTLLSLFKNAFTVAIVIFALMTILSQLGIDIAPLLAGAGVIGLAIGFGSQKLVEDIITGVFIQLESAMNEGDVVSVAGITGSVERLTIRSVGLRDLSGVYHIVPFSAVSTVSNTMRSFSYHVAEIGVAYDAHLPDVKQAMSDAYEALKETHAASLIGDFEMHGITALADSSVTVRARFMTVPGEQFLLGREYTELVKQLFDEWGIEIPFPHRTVTIASGAKSTSASLPSIGV